MAAGYLSLYRSGELQRRLERLEARLAACDLCPHKCCVNRLQGEKGWCHAGYLPSVASVCAHFGEEPALSGERGSGTVFFAGCNMACLYCQNYQISQSPATLKSGEIDCDALVEKLLELQASGCHNINFVSPSHFVPQMVRAVLKAAELGLTLPLVYNTSGYDSVATLKELDGIIDIYLPDIRYADEVIGRKLSRAPEYPVNARAVIKEMFRQVGKLKVDENGIAERGLIVRHLVLPDGLAGSRSSLAWLAREVSSDVTVSLMSQYRPAHRALKHPLLSRRIMLEEYREAASLLSEFGITNGWVQELDSPDSYLPDFAREGSPFVPE